MIFSLNIQRNNCEHDFKAAVNNFFTYATAKQHKVFIENWILCLTKKRNKKLKSADLFLRYSLLLQFLDNIDQYVVCLNHFPSSFINHNDLVQLLIVESDLKIFESRKTILFNWVLSTYMKELQNDSCIISMKNCLFNLIDICSALRDSEFFNRELEDWF